MSQAHHGEPLRWHWLYIPLVAYLVFAVGPSVLAPIFFILSLFVDISSIIGPAQHAPGIGSILLEPIFLGLIFWPFLWLYGCARDELIKDPTFRELHSIGDDHVGHRNELAMFAVLDRNASRNDVIRSRCRPGNRNRRLPIPHFLATARNPRMVHWPRDRVALVALTPQAVHNASGMGRRWRT